MLKRKSMLNNNHQEEGVGRGQAGVVLIKHTSYLYDHCMWTEFQLISIWLRGYSPGTMVTPPPLPIKSTHASMGRSDVFNKLKWVQVWEVLRKLNFSGLRFPNHVPVSLDIKGLVEKPKDQILWHSSWGCGFMVSKDYGLIWFEWLCPINVKINFICFVCLLE